VGDGYSDRCVSLATERRFARAELADWLDGQGVAYEPFDDLCDVLAALSTRGAVSALAWTQGEVPATAEGDDRRRAPPSIDPRSHLGKASPPGG
jgi:hypothetical protein